MWGYRTCRVAGVRALVRPSHPHVGLLFRVWATPPMYGTGGPRAGQVARVRNRRPACGRRGAALHQACRNARKLAMWSLGLLIRTWACCSESGQPRPCTGQAARVRNRRPACGTHWSPSCFVQVPVGGGPPARSPHASLRLGVIDLEARPGPAAAPGHRFCPRVPQPSLLLPSEPGGCCGGMRQAVAVFDRCGIAK